MLRLVFSTWIGMLMATCYSMPSEAEQVSLQHLPVVQAFAAAARLDKSQLPKGATVRMEAHQGYQFKSSGAFGLSVVPFEFTYQASQGRSRTQCALLFSDTEGKRDYVAALGPDQVERCQKLLAIGTMSDKGPHPRLIAIFATLGGRDAAMEEPYILAWDPAVSSYKLDPATTEWVSMQEDAQTVPDIRKLLAIHP